MRGNLGDFIRSKTYGIQRRLYLAVSIVGVLLILLVSLSIGIESVSLLEKNTKASIRQINQILVNSLELTIEDMYRSLFELSTNSLLAILEDPEYLGTDDHVKAQGTIMSYLTAISNSKQYDSVYLILPRAGRVLSQNTFDTILDGTEEQIRALPLFRQVESAEKETGVLSAIPRVSRGPSNLFGAFYRMKSGIQLVVTMDRNYFDRVIKDINVRADRFDHLVLLDETGRILYSSTRSASEMLKSLPAGQSLMDVGSVRMEGETYLVFGQESDATGWSVFVLTEYRAIRRPSVQMMLTVSIVTGLFILCLLLVSRVLATRLARSAQRLKASMHLAAENQDHVIEVIRSNDEIQDLSQSLKHMMEEFVNNQVLTRDARIRALQQQINPHFLYNTFDVISHYILSGDREKANRLLEQLGDLFRYNARLSTRNMATIREEVENVRNYLDIMKIRMGERLEYSIEADPDLLARSTPRFILQPIVENAFIHGFQEMEGLCRVRIRVESHEVERHEPVIEFTIEDNGKGIEAERKARLESLLHAEEIPGMNEFGIGLLNIHARLRLTYGKPYGIRLLDLADGGTGVVLCIPFGRERTT